MARRGERKRGRSEGDFMRGRVWPIRTKKKSPAVNGREPGRTAVRERGSCRLSCRGISKWVWASRVPTSGLG